MTVRVVRYSLAVLCVVAFCYSLILARSIILVRQNTAQSVARAIKLVPCNDRYLVRLAAADTTRSEAILKQALSLNPFDAESWIQLGLRTEIMRQNPVLAEHYYQRAAEVNHMTLPRWTLANFYFRRQNKGQFYIWARKTLEITPYDGAPVFTSLWSTDTDPERIEQAIPDKIRTWVQYSVFLTNTGRLDLVAPVLEKAIARSPAELPHNSLVGYRPIPLGRILDRLLKGARVEPAIELWSRLMTAHWIPTRSVPTPLHPLTNMDFQQPFFAHGFDWIPPSIPGVSLDSSPEPGHVRFEFSGSQPEKCTVLQQFVPLCPGRRYRLTWAVESEQLGGNPGLIWRIYGIGGDGSAPVPTPSVSPSIAPGGKRPGDWVFEAPSGFDLFLLTLQYSRPLGQTRFDGSLSLHNVSLTLQ